MEKHIRNALGKLALTIGAITAIGGFGYFVKSTETQEKPDTNPNYIRVPVNLGTPIEMYERVIVDEDRDGRADYVGQSTMGGRVIYVTTNGYKPGRNVYNVTPETKVMTPEMQSAFDNVLKDHMQVRAAITNAPK
jgi:hypothetical protein